MSEATVGKSEEMLGTWLKQQQRDKVIVATKVSRHAGTARSTGAGWAGGNCFETG